ncbi:MAG: hypothetical protein HYT98_02015 [Candidatus Sungbacteria bacterium]|nr:hypothetical protein [Candidatus Sungbacteria bacterium]
MGLSFQEVERIKKQFERVYFFAAPYSEYVNMCGISKVSIKDKDKIAPIDEQGDFCISVGLCKPLPQGLSLPMKYCGVRVFPQVIGKIKVL